MPIFISQSGQRSHALAEELQRFIRLLVPEAAPWMAPTGIQKGTRWGQQLTEALATAGGGLVCLTPENLIEPWILFEAGALSREPSNRVWTFLLDVTDAQLGPQLAQFQNTKATRGDVLLMVQAINATMATKPRTEADLEILFDKFWPDLEKRIGEIKAMAVVAAPAPRPDHDVLAELQADVREIGNLLGRGANDSWRIQKTLGVVSRLFQEVTGKPAPSMAQLAAMQAAERDGVTFTIPPGGLVASGFAPHLAAASGVTEPPLVLRESAGAGEAPASDARAK